MKKQEKKTCAKSIPFANQPSITNNKDDRKEQEEKNATLCM